MGGRAGRCGVATAAAGQISASTTEREPRGRQKVKRAHGGAFGCHGPWRRGLVATGRRAARTHTVHSRAG